MNHLEIILLKNIILIVKLKYIINYKKIINTYSSVGQSASLMSRRSQVQVLLGVTFNNELLKNFILINLMIKIKMNIIYTYYFIYIFINT